MEKRYRYKKIYLAFLWAEFALIVAAYILLYRWVVPPLFSWHITAAVVGGIIVPAVIAVLLRRVGMNEGLGALILMFYGCLAISVARWFFPEWRTGNKNDLSAVVTFGIATMSFLAIIVVMGTKSVLIVGPEGVEIRNDAAARTGRITWDEIEWLEYRKGRFPRGKDGIMIHPRDETSVSLFVYCYRENYVDALREIVAGCRKANPDFPVDEQLQKRLEDHS